MTAAAVLAQHIDQPHDPTRRHRCVLLDERRLRCHDCQRTLMLPTAAGSTSTSRSPIPGPGEPRCPQHHTEHANTCRWCAADAKAHPQADLEHGHRDHTHKVTADVAVRAAEARAQLPPRRDITHVTPDADAERMAQARAEIAARRTAPMPEDVDA